MMNCEEIRRVSNEYVDNRLTLPSRMDFEAHLQECPLCRVEIVEMQSLLRGLRYMQRPAAPEGLAIAISDVIRVEAASRRRRDSRTFSDNITQWIQPRLMPYTVGAFASLLFFAVMFAGLRSSLMAFHDWDVAARNAENARQFQIVFVPGGDEGPDITIPISSEGYAARRAPFSTDSPSLDPQGALAALTRSVSLNREGDDDMVVVADVFGNGTASLADVVQAPRDPRMLDNLQSALRKNPAFVPASFDRRPQTMRVVFVIQKVDVREREF